MPTIRAEFHRLRPSAQTQPRREVGSSVFQVFAGAGTVAVGEHEWALGHGDLFVLPSWQPLRLVTDQGLDLFRFSVHPSSSACTKAAPRWQETPDAPSDTTHPAGHTRRPR